MRKSFLCGVRHQYHLDAEPHLTVVDGWYGFGDVAYTARLTARYQQIAQIRQQLGPATYPIVIIDDTESDVASTSHVIDQVLTTWQEHGLSLWLVRQSLEPFTGEDRHHSVAFRTFWHQATFHVLFRCEMSWARHAEGGVSGLFAPHHRDQLTTFDDDVARLFAHHHLSPRPRRARTMASMERELEGFPVGACFCWQTGKPIVRGDVQYSPDEHAICFASR